jgi:L-histidine Nalpha-methyltransferase
MNGALAQPLARANVEAGPLAGALQEVLTGLASTPKRLPCKLLYDARGSALFERITQLPEYYCTRAEVALLLQHGGEMASRLGPDRVLIELGSGSSRKTRLLLDRLVRPIAYVPIDISVSALEASARALRTRYPALDIRPLVADYTQGFQLPRGLAAAPVSVFFPGSTIGNFEPAGAVEFLSRLRGLFGPGQRWLIGVDTPKERGVLERAYDDAEGVTAAFNRNILVVLNRVFAADFQPDRFAHCAQWKPHEGRVEMQLRSLCAQQVRVGPASIQLAAGEPIVTEHCYKYTPHAFRQLAAQAGLEVERVWVEERERFSVHLLGVA